MILNPCSDPVRKKSKLLPIPLPVEGCVKRFGLHTNLAAMQPAILCLQVSMSTRTAADLHRPLQPSLWMVLLE